MLYNNVKAQTFFKTGGLQRYFIVDIGQISNTTLSTSCQTAATVKEQLAEWDTTKQAHQEKAQIMDAEVAKTDKTGWFKRTSWLEHFANRNLIHLAHQVRLPIPRPHWHPYKGAAISRVLLGIETTRAARILTQMAIGR